MLLSEIIVQGRLTWFGHLERKDTSDCVSDCRNMQVVGSRGKGEKRQETRKNADMASFGLRSRQMVQDRVKWRGCIVGKQSNPC